MKTLTDLYQSHTGKVSDKWALYLREYDRIFSPYRDQPISLLEIGVQNGGSLEIWSQYFESAQRFVGCDINPDCAKLRYEDSRISVIVGDATSDETRKKVLQQSASFDVVIEDGSHTSRDIVKAFEKYFPILSEGGVFVAEDLHCSYWQEFEGGIFHPYSSVNFFKFLADVINHEHWGVPKKRVELIAGFEKKYSVEISEALLSEVHSVEFLNSICIVRKFRGELNRLGGRRVSGTEECVVEGLLLRGPQNETIQQNSNYWSGLIESPAESHLQMLEQTEESKSAAIAAQEASQRLRDALQAQEAEALRLSNDLRAQQSETVRLRDDLQAQESESQRLRDDLQAQESESQRLRDDLQAQESESQRLRDDSQVQRSEVTHLNHVLQAIQVSRSWRYTAMLRKVGAAARPPVRLIRRIRQTAKQNGGYANLLRKATTIARKEGVNGLVQRAQGVSQKHSVVVPAVFNAIIDRNDYQVWIKKYDTLDAQAILRIRHDISDFAINPKISVIMPVYNVPLQFLEEAIRSVRDQLYENWELCIADDASTDLAVRPLLESYAQKDQRIKVIFRSENGHISAASNTALTLASGEFVALLDNDDLLPVHALYHVIKAIHANPDVALIYSDEDKINAIGERYDPYFKCDLNIELLLAQNMVSHLGVYRRDILEAVKGFRVGFEGSQDYDLVLRVLENVKSNQVVHLPHVLYHWRAIPGSTALASGEKSYTVNAAHKAVAEHLERTGRLSVVCSAPDAPSFNRVRYSLPVQLPFVSIIIPTRDRADLLDMCLNSVLRKSTYENYEIIVVDNGSVEEETEKLLDRQPKDRVRVIRDDSPFNYSRLNNLAVEKSNGNVICLMNNDIEVLTPDWLEEMLSFAMQPDIGCVGARLWYPDGRLQHGGVILGLGGVAGHSHKYLPKGAPGYFGRAVLHQSLSAVTGACLMVRREVYERNNGLDEEFAVAFNDVDFCLRVRESGYRNVWTPCAEMIHHESVSRGQEDTPEKQARFKGEVDRMEARWGGILRKDTAYSPNLTLAHDDFSLGWH